MSEDLEEARLVFQSATAGCPRRSVVMRARRSLVESQPRAPATAASRPRFWRACTVGGKLHDDVDQLVRQRRAT